MNHDEQVDLMRTLTKCVEVGSIDISFVPHAILFNEVRERLGELGMTRAMLASEKGCHLTMPELARLL